MHRYATNNHSTEKLIWFIALVAISSASAIGWFTWRMEGWLGGPVGSVSSVGLFGLLFLCFDRYLWRCPLVQRMLLIPNLNGPWEVLGRTVSKNGGPVDWKWDGEVRISQSWSRIRVVLTTRQSKSESIAASLYWQAGEGYRLIYHYDNAPRADQPDLKRHSGLCDLLFDTEAVSAEGHYFTGGHRLTIGTLQLRRKELEQ